MGNYVICTKTPQKALDQGFQSFLNSIRSSLLLLAIIVTANIYSLPVFAVVFGVDDRIEVFHQPTLNKTVSPSVGLMVSPVYLIDDPMGFITDFPKISDKYEVALCKGERFYGQPTASVTCTGFLVASNLVLTAGHCMTHLPHEIRNGKTGYCSDFKWVFDYKYENADLKLNPMFPSENVANCEEIIYAKFDYKKNRSQNPNAPQIHGEDIALIRLDRHLNRPILNLNPSVKTNDTVTTVGHPTGLPQKATLNGRIVDTKHKHYFTTNLDIFGGNSGSPVINNKNEAVGIVVRAFPSDDYKYSDKEDCARVNKCTQDLKKCDVNNDEDGTIMHSHAQIITPEILELIKENAQYLL